MQSSKVCVRLRYTLMQGAILTVRKSFELKSCWVVVASVAGCQVEADISDGQPHGVDYPNNHFRVC